MPMENPGYEFYNKVLGKPKMVIAPMVEQSELAFRLLCRENGAQLCYTPMWHAGIFAKDEKYRKAAIEEAPNDRPLLFQFCANKPETFADACALAEPYCDGVDLNLGCPQVIAQRGHYGAFLMEEIDLVEDIIRTASLRISKPITCKIRVFEKIEDTANYAKRLERAGAKIITVHGRLRKQKGPLTGIANWDHIKAVKESVSVPVFANGNIQFLRDVEKCFQYTGVDAVMSAEGVLYNPALFMGKQPPVWEMADKYIAYARKHPPPLGYVRGHMFRMWHHCLCKHTDLRTPMGVGKTFDALVKVSNELKARCKIDAEKDVAAGNDSEEPGNIPYWRCQPYVRPPPKLQGKRTQEETSNETTAKKNKPISKRKLLQMKHREHGKGLFPKTPRDKWPLCETCLVNPWGTKCSYKRCRKCCREKSEKEILDCPGHRLWFHKNLSAQKERENGIRQQNLEDSEKPAIVDADNEIHTSSVREDLNSRGINESSERNLCENVT